MADFSTSLGNRRQEEQQKLEGLIRGKTEEINEVIRRSQDKTDMSFKSREDTLEQYTHALLGQTQDREAFEKVALRKLESIQTTVPPGALPYDEGAQTRIENHFEISLDEINRRTKYLETGGASIRENSNRLESTKTELHTEANELLRAETEIKNEVDSLQKRLQEVSTAMRESLEQRKVHINSALCELTSDIASSIAEIQASMDEKEREVEVGIDRIRGA